MEGDCWLRAFSNNDGANLARVRRSAAAFLSRLLTGELQGRDRWIDNWIKIGDGYQTSAELALNTSLDSANEAWLCALTAFEVAKQLTSPDDSTGRALAERVEISLGKIECSHVRPLERVETNFFDHAVLRAYFLPAASGKASSPVVICIADKEVSIDAMLSRLLPATSSRRLSTLIVDGGDAFRHHRFRPEAFLGSWLDYLERRPDVDASRIAVSGEGMAASFASSLVASDRRIAAAVCDGGLWSSRFYRANVCWMTGNWESAWEQEAETRRFQFARRTRCPVLIVAGGRAIVNAQDALEVQADCKRVGVECSVAISQTPQSISGEFENFIVKDDFIFDWLEQKLGLYRQFEAVSYL